MARLAGDLRHFCALFASNSRPSAAIERIAENAAAMPGFDFTSSMRQPAVILCKWRRDVTESKITEAPARSRPSTSVAPILLAEI